MEVSLFFLDMLVRGWDIILTYKMTSAFVGLATLLMLTPLPGYLTKLVQDVQKSLLKTTDARVQTVTESS